MVQIIFLWIASNIQNVCILTDPPVIKETLCQTVYIVYHLDSTTKFEGVGSKGISNVIQTNFQAIASDININPVFLRAHCFYKIDKGKKILE